MAEAKVPKLVGVTSEQLQVGDFAGISYRPLTVNADADLDEFRESFRKLFACEYVVIDVRNHVTGMYAGFCLAHQIPFITVGVEGFYGSYCDFGTLDEWGEFVDALQEQDWTLVAEAG